MNNELEDLSRFCDNDQEFRDMVKTRQEEKRSHESGDYVSGPNRTGCVVILVIVAGALAAVCYAIWG